jgi:proteasome lid subunit RPN8/RPN11
MVEFKNNDSEKEICVSDYPPASILIGEEVENDDLKIFIDEYILSEIDSYLSSDVKKELGGVLLGGVNIDVNGNKFITISNLVIAQHTDASVSRLTFTHDTWEYINNKIDDEYSDKIIVGWFHSHPGHSVFLSDYDVFIQENFFDADFMTAYVFDPTISERGFFFMKDGKVEKAKGYNVFPSPYKKKNNSDLNTVNIDGMDEFRKNNYKMQNNLKLKDVIIFALLIANIILSLILLYNYSEMKKETLNANELNKKISDLKEDYGKLNEKLDGLILSTEVVEDTNNAQMETQNIAKYQVKDGDNLKKIALNFYKDETKFNLIIRHNKLRDEFDIFTGQILEIPLIENTK